MNRPRSIALVDLSYIFKRAWHTSPANRSPHQRAELAIEHVAKLEQGVDHVILCRDAKPYDRTVLYPQYKAKRPEPEEGEVPQRRWFLEEMTRRGYPMGWAQGAEGDDVIATLARIYSEWCEDVRIVGPDKDMAQCLTDRVKQYIPPDGKNDWIVRDVAAATDKFKVRPALMPFFQGLCGDESDNVPGVRGIGPVNAARIANTYGTFLELQLAMTRDPHAEKPAVVKAFQEQWDQLLLSIKLVTLDSHLNIDAEALLVRGEAKPEAPRKNSMDLAPEPELTIERNETPMPPPPAAENDTVLEEAKRLYHETRPAIDAKISELEQKQPKAIDWASKSNPNDFTGKPFVPRKTEPEPKQATNAILVPAATQTKYGLVTSNLQPIDLHSAYTISQWILNGNLFKQYKNEAQIFTIMLRAKELDIGICMALANHHVIEGKPVANADLIRALAERDPSCEYLMPVEISGTKATWEGKNKNHPRPVSYSYTLEEAKAAGLVCLTSYGKPNNWMLRPQDMCVKTAGSKLARLLWPGATMGFYCPEELGHTAEELEIMREAA